MRIFIDVGGYFGHSTLAALDPLFGFDRIFCFEPVPDLARRLREVITDKRVTVVQAALTKRDGATQMYHAGTLAGTIYHDGPEYGGSGNNIVVPAIAAATFLKMFVAPEDFVRVKLNCEGAELEIVESLLETGSAWVLNHSLIDFDAAKIPSLAPRLEDTISRLKDADITYLTPPECQYGMVTNYGAVRNYLICSGAVQHKLSNRLRSLFYNLKCALRSDLNGYHKMKLASWMPFLRVFQRSLRAQS